METLLTKKEFEKALREELNKQLTLEHPIFEELLTRKDNFLIKKMALQGYRLTKYFLEYIEHLFYTCPIPSHKRKLLFNMFEEETGYFSKTDNHVTLMQNFLNSLGISKQERDKEVAYPETRELIEYRMRLVKDIETYHMGVAAVQIASEGQNLETKAHQARHTILREEFNMNQKDLLFFSVHQNEDVYHVQEGIDLVVDICSSRKMQNDAVEAVKTTCGLFYNMYDGIYRRDCLNKPR